MNGHKFILGEQVLTFILFLHSCSQLHISVFHTAILSQLNSHPCFLYLVGYCHGIFILISDREGENLLMFFANAVSICFFVFVTHQVLSPMPCSSSVHCRPTRCGVSPRCLYAPSRPGTFLSVVPLPT